MEQEIKKSKNDSKTFWQSTIALIFIVLVVLVGGVIVILLQGGHSISGQEVFNSAAFPLIIFIPIWILLLRKMEKPTPKQEKIIRIMLITTLILLVANVLVYWLL